MMKLVLCRCCDQLMPATFDQCPRCGIARRKSHAVWVYSFVCVVALAGTVAVWVWALA